MIETIIIVLVILWLLGLMTHIAGGLVYILLIVALVLLIMRLARGRNL